MTETHTPDGSVWRYSYDAFGRRIKKECVKAGNTGKKSSVSYLWQGATLAEEHRTTGETTEVTRWHFEPGTFNPLAKETNGNFYPIVTDHLGTPKELFNTDGNCIWQAEHSLWGETTVAWQKMQQPGRFKPLVDCNLRFQNQWEDEESGLHYNLNRYYDPDSGQYLSPDPIGLEGGLRTHGYVHDPMQWVDPLGLAGCPKALYKYDARTKNYHNTKTGKFVSVKKLPWPKYPGVAGKSKITHYPKGTVIDRFGSLDGEFAGLPGSSVSARGLPAGSEGRPYTKLRVIKPINVPTGKAAGVPDFGATGGADQLQFKGGIQKWIDAKYLEVITS